MFDIVSSWSNIIAPIPYEVQLLYHIMLQASPVKLVCGRYIILDMDLQPNYKEIFLRKINLINYNNKHKTKIERNMSMSSDTTCILQVL